MFSLHTWPSIGTENKGNLGTRKATLIPNTPQRPKVEGYIRCSFVVLAPKICILMYRDPLMVTHAVHSDSPALFTPCNLAGGRGTCKL